MLHSPRLYFVLYNYYDGDKTHHNYIHGISERNGNVGNSVSIMGLFPRFGGISCIFQIIFGELLGGRSFPRLFFWGKIASFFQSLKYSSAHYL
jgi:hypothetical protein